MRLLINVPITVSGSFGLEDLENGEQDYVRSDMENMASICKEFNIAFDYAVYVSGYEATLQVQKIDLDEIAMNEFLNEAFQVFDSLKLKYNPRAVGCEVSMELV